MEIKKFNISRPDKYITKSGEQKTIWHNCGLYTEFHKDNGDISRIIEIPTIGLKANIFPFQLKKEKEINEENINLEDMPF